MLTACFSMPGSVVYCLSLFTCMLLFELIYAFLYMMNKCVSVPYLKMFRDQDLMGISGHDHYHLHVVCLCKMFRRKLFLVLFQF